MTLYYVSWITDCSYGAMHVHALFESPDLPTAKREWKNLVRDQNGCAIAVAYNKKPDYEELWALPDFLQDKSKEQILDYYAPPERCSFARKDYCYSSEKCKKFIQPFGCYQQKYDEWVSRWGTYLPTPDAGCRLGLINSFWLWLKRRAKATERGL